MKLAFRQETLPSSQVIESKLGYDDIEGLDLNEHAFESGVFRGAGVDIEMSVFRHQVDAFAARHGHIAPPGKTYDLVPTSCRRMSTPIWSDRIRAVPASVL
jgi:hypothetical protein